MRCAKNIVLLTQEAFIGKYFFQLFYSVKSDMFIFGSIPQPNKIIDKNWSQILKERGKSVSKNTQLCSDHFEPECFEFRLWMGKEKKFLKPGKIPTIFDTDKHNRYIKNKQSLQLL